MTKQEQIEEISNIIAEVAFVQAHEENGDENLSDIVATVLYNAGYRKVPKDSVVLSREEYEKGVIERESMRKQITELFNDREQARKETAKEILDMLYDMGIDKEILECCRIYDVDGVSLVKQICEKYGVEIEE